MMLSPLALDGWLEFNRLKWNLQPLRLRYPQTEASLPSVETVLYLDRRGRIVHPKLNPYLPVAFTLTPAQGLFRLYRQWLAITAPLVQEMRTRGLRSTIGFPPEVVDVRPWQWAGFRAGVQYTFYIEFPFDLQRIDQGPRKKIKQAFKAGYRVERITNMADVLACLCDTEERQEFSYHLTVQDLEVAKKFLGEDDFRAYVCYAPNGDPASSKVILHHVGGRAVGWIAGTKTDHLQSGAAQLVISYSLDDLQVAGASGFDFCGANLPTVSAAKMNWGGRLVPYYCIESCNLRTMALWAFGCFQFILGRGDTKHAVRPAFPNLPAKSESAGKETNHGE